MRSLVAGLALVSLVTACGGPRLFTRGEYRDPAEINMLDDKWNENDMQLTAKRVITSLEEWVDKQKVEGKPVVILETFKNRTSEHIDTQSLYDHIKTALIQSGEFTFLDKAARQEIAGEYEYQQSGYVDPKEAKGPGKQKAAQYLLGGAIGSNVQEAGPNKVVYYIATFELTNIETTEIIWTDEKEISKHFKKKSVGF